MRNLFKNIVKEISEQKGVLLISTSVKGSNKKPIFEVFVDSKIGITADYCASLSREIKEKLESTDVGDLDYQLIVSSPGTDEPIKFVEQYYKHIGREFKISYQNEDSVQSIEAKLVEISDDLLTFEYKKELLNINFNNIKKAKVKISF